MITNTNLTNQRQLFFEENVRSGNRLKTAKNGWRKDTHTYRNKAWSLLRECADYINEFIGSYSINFMDGKISGISNNNVEFEMVNSKKM